MDFDRPKYTNPAEKFWLDHETALKLASKVRSHVPKTPSRTPNRRAPSYQINGETYNTAFYCLVEGGCNLGNAVTGLPLAAIGVLGDKLIKDNIRNKVLPLMGTAGPQEEEDDVNAVTDMFDALRYKFVYFYDDFARFRRLLKEVRDEDKMMDVQKNVAGLQDDMADVKVRLAEQEQQTKYSHDRHDIMERGIEIGVANKPSGNSSSSSGSNQSSSKFVMPIKTSSSTTASVVIDNTETPDGKVHAETPDGKVHDVHDGYVNDDASDNDNIVR